jgi:hypothetical protein
MGKHLGVMGFGLALGLLLCAAGGAQAQQCASNRQCLSQKCIAGRCASPAPAGPYCTRDADCVRGSACVNVGAGRQWVCRPMARPCANDGGCKRVNPAPPN